MLLIAMNYFFHRIHRSQRISYISLPQKSMRWILRWTFVRNAMKCGEIFICIAFTAITEFFTKFHRIQRISCKYSPENLDSRSHCQGTIQERRKQICIYICDFWLSLTFEILQRSKSLVKNLKLVLEKWASVSTNCRS